MKKLLSIVLSLLFILTIIPLNVSADESNTSERDKLIAEACEIFPDYADKILGQSASTYSIPRGSDAREIVHSETRSVSDTEEMTYTEYSDGIVLLTASSYDFNYTITDNDHYSNSGGSVTNITIRATCSGPSVSSGYFELRNVIYTIAPSSYDTINSTGTPYYYGSCSLHTAYSPIRKETATTQARIKYRLTFQIGSTGYSSFNSLLTLTVGNNTAKVTHVNDT